MSFSKAKLKRFNDVDVICGSPATASNSASVNSLASTVSASSAQNERKEQIEKFFKDAVRLASNTKDQKEAQPKEDKKHKGLRLFRTPSLPQRLRFRTNHDSANNNNNGIKTTSSTPLSSATNTPSKSATRLKGKEALQQEIRTKNEIIQSYLSQIDVLERHIQQLKDTEHKLREENENMQMKTNNLVEDLTNGNLSKSQMNAELTEENAVLKQNLAELQLQLETLKSEHVLEVSALLETTADLKTHNTQLEKACGEYLTAQTTLKARLEQTQQEVIQALQKLEQSEKNSQKNLELLENVRNNNKALIEDVNQLKKQIEQDSLNYAQETRTMQNEMDLLKNERNTLKNDLANKCDLISNLQEELLDKNCEIDAHCDTIRQLCREKAKYVEKEQLMDSAEQKVFMAEQQAEEKVQKLESDLETALAQEKSYWLGELEKRQKIAENEIIKVELEKQDVMILLETTNDMLRDRDDKIQKYEEQLRNGLDYYINLTDTLQKQVVDLKQEMAKTITEKYNYQLTLNNTRSTVNILMERLKKSDADVERYKAELESLQLAKGALEGSYLALQQDMEIVRSQWNAAERALISLRSSSENLKQEVCVKESMLNDMLSSEEETLAKFNKIASSFQERIDADASHYLDIFNELRTKDEKRENYIQDMKKALDEFATVLQIAQIELDSKEKLLLTLHDECEKLKLENISLKSKVEENQVKKENITDLEKIEDLLIDTELRVECDKIATWLLNSSTDKCARDSAQEMNELLKPNTPINNKTRATTPVRSSTGKVNTPHTPKTPRTPRSTPKKTALFVGKENIPSPTTNVLKARNV